MHSHVSSGVSGVQGIQGVPRTVKKELSASLGKVTDNRQQVQSDIQEATAETEEQRDKETC